MPNELRFPYWVGHFGTSRSFMIKKMRFKRIIRHSCIVLNSCT
ncbi:hypothetical protein Goshw_013826, partial [Gossypium schwendimanii]|nr:hypothetical protein [Gossypium schwendimanii]